VASTAASWRFSSASTARSDACPEDGARLTGPWEAVTKALRKLPKQIDDEIRLATQQNAAGLVGAIKRGITSGTFLDGSKLKELHPFTVLRRLSTLSGKDRERAVQRLAAGKSAKPLFNEGDLSRSFTYKVSDDGWSAAIGVNKTAMTKDGKSMVNIAATLFHGKSIAVTEKMRGWLAANGMHLKKTTTHIVIPPRDPITPTYKAYKQTMIDRYKQVLGRIFKGIGK
jgi:hypothetical protein